MKAKPKDYYADKSGPINFINIKGDQSVPIPESSQQSLANSKFQPSKRTTIHQEEARPEKDEGEAKLTPRTLIYNSIISNIKAKIYDTKIEYYKIGKVIGKGAFGKVNLAVHRLTGKFVALKSINKSFMSDESSHKKVM